MLIRELEEKTGLERATIRYYEKEGFITPHREMLLKIKLLHRYDI